MPGHHMGLSDRTLLSQVIAPQAVTTGAVNGTVVDMLGWDGIRFEVNVGAITGAGTIDGFVARSAAANMSNATNITGAALTQVTTGSGVAVIEVWRPQQRYLRLTLTQAANTVAFGATATRYRRGGNLPPTQAATQVVRIAEG